MLTRATCMEVCFGNHANEEANIATSILRSLLKLKPDMRTIVAQNIILAGGSCMVPGFKLRLEQELKYLIETYAEFTELADITKYIKTNETQFPTNCMVWVGASLLGILNSEIERFACTEKEFKENGEVLPDRFGDAYLFGAREESYLNPDFEFKNQYEKQAMYASMSPYSARSFQEKKMTINQQLEKTLAGLKTPTKSQIGNITPTGSELRMSDRLSMFKSEKNL